MPKAYDSTFTMFVYLKGHHLLEYYFSVADTRSSANDAAAQIADIAVTSSRSAQPWRRP